MLVCKSTRFSIYFHVLNSFCFDAFWSTLEGIFVLINEFRMLIPMTLERNIFFQAVSDDTTFKISKKAIKQPIKKKIWWKLTNLRFRSIIVSVLIICQQQTNAFLNTEVHPKYFNSELFADWQVFQCFKIERLIVWLNVTNRKFRLTEQINLKQEIIEHPINMIYTGCSEMKVNN